MRLAVFVFMMVLAQTLFAVTASPAEAQEEAFYKFTSEPAGVSIYIDGKLVGKAEPAVSGVIAAGAHKIRAEYSGYSPVEVTLHFKADELIKRNFKLEPSSVSVESLRDSEEVRLSAQVGNLQILSVPPDLPVTVGGKKIGQNTPCIVKNLAVGEVRIEIDGHGLTAVVKKGTTAKIRYDLKQNTYKVQYPDERQTPAPERGELTSVEMSRPPGKYSKRYYFEYAPAKYGEFIWENDDYSSALRFQVRDKASQRIMVEVNEPSCDPGNHNPRTYVLDLDGDGILELLAGDGNCSSNQGRYWWWSIYKADGNLSYRLAATRRYRHQLEEDKWWEERATPTVVCREGCALQINGAAFF